MEKYLQLVILLVEEIKRGHNKANVGKQRCDYKYLLNQTLRQYVADDNHCMISKQACDLWTKITDESMLNYTYRDVVKKTIAGEIEIEKYVGASSSPKSICVLKEGDSFIYRDVFSDEHIVPIKMIIDELINLPVLDFENIKMVLDKIYICKMMKSEEKKIKPRYNRSSTNYKDILQNEYRGIEIVKR